MNRATRGLTAVVGLLCVSWAGAARGQDGAFPVPKPTSEHAVLKHDVGTWDATVKVWTDPKGEPQTSKGTETNRLLPGGLWLTSQFRGEFGGQTFHGRGQTGYDPVKKKYVGTWIDTMSPSIMTMEGTYDAATKTMTMLGEATGPDGKPAKFKNVSVAKADGTRVFTMSMQAPGSDEWVKSMEITYTKRPEPAPKKKAADQ